MSVMLLTIALALGWAAATGSFTLPNLLLGVLVGGAGLFVIRRYVSRPNKRRQPRRRRWRASSSSTSARTWAPIACR